MGFSPCFSWPFMMGNRQNRTHSIREIFFCSLRKTFAHFSDTSKKAERTSAVGPGHYTPNKVFVSTVGQRVSCHGSGWLVWLEVVTHLHYRGTNFRGTNFGWVSRSG